MPNKRDYYDILGISKTASQEEIKNAYRKMAREHHPDMAAEEGKARAEAQFKEINEAYQILSNPEKRAAYDRFGHAVSGYSNGFSGGQGFNGQQGPFSYTYTTSGDFDGADPFDIFEQVFGFRGFGGAARRPRKGKNLFYELQISFVDALRGAQREVSIESGRVKIKIPAGASDGTELRFEGRGMPGPQGAPTGDLYITLRVSIPARFRRAGENLLTVEEIDFVQAILGDTIEISTIDSAAASGVGTAKLKIPAGTQSGTQFRLRGKGMPILRSDRKGDVFVQVMVRMPVRLTKEQKRLLEEYRKLGFQS